MFDSTNEGFVPAFENELTRKMKSKITLLLNRIQRLLLTLCGRLLRMEQHDINSIPIRTVWIVANKVSWTRRVWIEWALRQHFQKPVLLVKQCDQDFPACLEHQILRDEFVLLCFLDIPINGEFYSSSVDFNSEVLVNDNTHPGIALMIFKPLIPWYSEKKRLFRLKRFSGYQFRFSELVEPAIDLELVSVRLNELAEMISGEMLVRTGSLSQHLSNMMHISKNGEWSDEKGALTFIELPSKISLCNHVLGNVVKPHAVVAVMLPLSAEGMLINTFLAMISKCVVNISPDLDNEERMAVMRSNGINLLITSSDLDFTRFAPNAAELVYIEDIRLAMERKKCLQQQVPGSGCWTRDLRNWFHPVPRPEDVVAIICEKDKEKGVNSLVLKSSDIFNMLNSMGKSFRNSGKKKLSCAIEISDLSGYLMGWVVPLFYDLKVRLKPGRYRKLRFN